ncbi:TPA: LysR family transcriptional regulator [Burkholderia aenigmatica]|uniref:LysR family transcriptional regulator n=1 Tax=Burkholderia sp. AU45251 TaxID=3059204 RepID=UPI002653B5FB|nr:LysR family transcriptional regulator [Burkholderia sp. AU45251]HDR9483381.1 LysR family transcriptional regulator [Burkholderia aenigmatica]MDN7516596.1 LysR family transcriptional regulator [Burkholderia sp. AU45251]HDR9514329.1 LysR family transcriptional regulator [Burkholderia aenigmatica]HDR9591719.1 LysR family transcriptional regulator [Burkholderia aenigmatica]HDR9600959.1 LysR family transcriptional regulator [Burkholderia aenigmatica]
MGEQSFIDDLNQLRVFAEVARVASITVAAQRLGKPKSTVSRDVARLESSLGTPLLARNGRRVVLTEAGVLFADRALRILVEIDEATDVVATTTETVRGVLTVQATYWLGHSLLIPLLPSFLAHFPKIDVVLELKDFANLSTQDWDVQITAGTLADSSFAARRVAEINLHLYASSAYIARNGAPQTFTDLIRHDVVDKHWANGTSPWVNFTGTQPAAIKPRLIVNDMIAILHAVREGAGIGWLPSLFAEQTPHDNPLIHVLPELRADPMSVYAIFPRRRAVSPKVRAFVDFVSEALVIQTPVYRNLLK